MNEEKTPTGDERARRAARVGRTVAVGVRQPHVPPPVTIGVDVRLSPDERPVGQTVPVRVEQPVVGRAVTVEVDHRPADRLRAVETEPAQLAAAPFESTLNAHVPEPSSVKDAS